MRRSPSWWRGTGPAAVDAAALVEVDYEPLPAVVSVEAAVADDVLVFPAAGTNLAHEAGALSDDDPFDGCEVVVTRQITNQRLAPVPMETRAAACAPDGNGGLRAVAVDPDAPCRP